VQKKFVRGVREANRAQKMRYKEKELIKGPLQVGPEFWSLGRKQYVELLTLGKAAFTKAVSL